MHLPIRHVSLYTLATALLNTGLTAQTSSSQDKMKASFAQMKTHSWFTGGGWTTDFDAAKAEAKKRGKPIFTYFTRTYSY